MIDPMRLAKTGEAISGSYNLHQLERVNALLEDTSTTQVSFELEFSRNDVNRMFYIVGNLETTLPLVCQRCLQPMQHQLSANVNMVIVRSEAEAETLADEFDPYIDAGVPVKLQDFIEDELLLAMPLVSLHKENECPAAAKFRSERSAKVNPFAELKNLKLRN